MVPRAGVCGEEKRDLPPLGGLRGDQIRAREAICVEGITHSHVQLHGSERAPEARGDGLGLGAEA